MGTKLDKEYEYYRTNQEELVQRYEGKVLVIKDQQVIGVYASDEEALIETRKTHVMGTFLMRRCSRDVDTEMQQFHSRVSFDAHGTAI